VVRECCNMVTITGSDRSSSMGGSGLLMYMVMLTPLRSGRAGKQGTASDRGVAAVSLQLPKSQSGG
jgi:hypothetical protein